MEYSDLTQPVPKERLHKRPDGLTNIQAYWVIDRLNKLFGPFGWFSEEIYQKTTENEFIMKIKLNIVMDDGVDGSVGHSVEADGGCEIKGLLSDAIKGARTNAICKAASYMGIGIEVYMGDRTDVAEGNDVDLPSEAGGVKTASPSSIVPDVAEIVELYMGDADIVGSTIPIWTPASVVTEFKTIKKKPIPDGMTWRMLYYQYEGFLNWVRNNRKGPESAKANTTITICENEGKAGKLYSDATRDLANQAEWLGIKQVKWISDRFYETINPNPDTVKESVILLGWAEENHLTVQKLMTICREARTRLGDEKGRKFLLETATDLGFKDVIDPLSADHLDLMIEAVRQKADGVKVGDLAGEDIPFHHGYEE